jgi:hypothetical protein
MTIFGSDVSHFDAPDTRPMLADGITFQTHKAGGDADDPEIGQWWTYVRGYRDRALLGAYWVLYPGRPAARADAFLARLDATCPSWREGPFILQADCEKWNGNPATVPPLADVNAFCDRLVKRVPKLRPIGYLPSWVYPDVSSFHYPVWGSGYGTNPAGHYREIYPGDASVRWASYGKKPDVLQYGSRATIGDQSTCDANAFRGTLDQLKVLVAPGWARAEVDDVSIEDVVAGNKQYDTPAVDPNGWKRNATGVSVWDEQFIPNPVRNTKTSAYQALGDLITQVLLVKQAVADLAGKDFTDEAAIVQGVLTGLTPAALTDAVVAALAVLPAATAKATADEIAARLSGNV